jgi:1-acyl-sn-glycerol-3-phosphate acyltransferase
VSATSAAERALLTRAWHGVYEFFYAGLKGGTTILFRALFRVRAIGPARLPDGGVLLCPNHQGYLDPTFVQLTARRRLTFVMTNDFYSSPWARWFFRLVGALPLGAGRQALTTTRRAVALLRLGHALVVFPEGRLSTDGSLSRGQRGIALLARRGRVPVVPVAIEGSRRAFGKGMPWMRRAHVRLAFGDPIRIGHGEGRESDQRFADDVMARVAALRERIPPARP